jgi:hypothetical protein
MRIFQALWAVTLAALLTACASTAPDNDQTGAQSPTVGAAAHTGAQPVMSSPECMARKLKPGDPFPVSAIPEALLKKAQSGSVAMRYDVIAGVAQNIVVVASSPPGVYDAPALQHAARYRDPTGSTVRGCVMTIDIKF